MDNCVLVVQVKVVISMRHELGFAILVGKGEFDSDFLVLWVFVVMVVRVMKMVVERC